MEFEWDDAKAAANRRKHGVSFDEAQEVYGDLFALTGPDVRDAGVEHRERTIGRSTKERVLVVISTYRSARIRIISARRATAREVRGYEKEVKRSIRGER